MAFSSNFTKLSRGRDDLGQDALFIEGKSDDKTLSLTAMYVNFVKQPAFANGNGTIAMPELGELTRVEVENARGAVDWRAVLDRGQLPAVGERVVAVGLAELRDEPSFFWAQSLKVEGFGR
jgi:hypothetical protein